MKKKIQQMLALICNALGTIAAVYVGGWLMFLQPLHVLYIAFGNGELSVRLVAVCAVKILLSATFAGLVWCIGYIGCNYFKGKEDPDWSILNGKTDDQTLISKES